MRWLLVIIIAVAAVACSDTKQTASNAGSSEHDSRVELLKKQRDAVVKFYKPMHVEEGDWLDSQHEPGQTFEEYIASNPTLPTAERRTIYIQPIGNFSAQQRNAIRLTADYMEVFYNLPVKLNADREIGNVPADLKREIGYPKNLQIRTTYFLDDVLPKLIPDDAAAFIAFTNVDLYPSDTWHFVFGQASLEKRVGVWSLYRLSDRVSKVSRAPDRLLTRTLKISMHEVGHMFGIRHCTKYECLMSGTNHLAETDRRPLDNCPECMAKVAWAMNYDPAERYKNLAAFWQKNKNPTEEKRMLEMAKAVAAVKN
ncbi:MAG: archaemetzincin [Pyrinomonadaceae bacterium]